jgi:hypothetical protein
MRREVVGRLHIPARGGDGGPRRRPAIDRADTSCAWMRLGVAAHRPGDAARLTVPVSIGEQRVEGPLAGRETVQVPSSRLK